MPLVGRQNSAAGYAAGAATRRGQLATARGRVPPAEGGPVLECGPQEADRRGPRHSPGHVRTVALLRRVRGAKDHSRVPKGARLFGGRRSHREHGGLDAVRQGMYAVCCIMHYVHCNCNLYTWTICITN